MNAVIIPFPTQRTALSVSRGLPRAYRDAIEKLKQQQQDNQCHLCDGHDSAT